MVIKISAITSKQIGVELQKLRHLLALIKEKVAKAQAAYKKFADLRQLPSPNYQVGNKVFLAMKYIQTTRPMAKLANIRTGPYKIIEIINKNDVWLVFPNLFGPTKIQGRARGLYW